MSSQQERESYCYDSDCYDSDNSENETFEEWKQQYTEYLNDIDNKKDADCPYTDPDTTWNEESSFYINLEIFLNEQEKSLCCKLEGNWEYKFNAFDSGGGIYVYEEDPDHENEILVLRSDQFGFSAPRKVIKATTLTTKYPYWKYINDAGNKGDAIAGVLSWIWHTRGIGGSFLWPLVKQRTNSGYKFESLYNMRRGIGSYIQDRVDLTLLEVRDFYECLFDFLKDSSNKLTEETFKGFIDKYDNDYPNNLLLKRDDKCQIIKWLSHFKNSKTYVEFFQFEDFVAKDGFPINITAQNTSLQGYNKSNGVTKRSKEELLPPHKQLKNTLECVATKAYDRSDMMTKIINRANKNASN